MPFGACGFESHPGHYLSFIDVCGIVNERSDYERQHAAQETNSTTGPLKG
jgi:hypothetical protein